MRSTFAPPAGHTPAMPAPLPLRPTLSVHRLDLGSAWARLSAAEQEVISLAVWEGLGSAQAGAVVGCSATAYRLRLSRARRALRRHLDEATSSASPRRTSATTTEGPLR